MLVLIRKICRVCREVPEKGFFPSRAKRYDWICPRCCMNRTNERRSTKDVAA